MIDVWADGAHYERYMGRWSRLVARELVDWIGIDHASWLDVGCGTGVLCEAIRERRQPASVRAIDASPAYVAAARARGFDAVVADAASLPFEDNSVDIAASALCLNFVPDPARAVAEMKRVARSQVAYYLWDYAGEMQFLRRFWDAAIALDPAAHALDEGVRFSLCNPERMRAITGGETRAIVVPTVFRDFDDFWEPFTGGQGPAPSYLASLDPAHRDRLRDSLRSTPLALTARAWAIRAVV